MDLSIRVIALILCCDRSRFASRHPHLSVVQVFKDRFCCAVSFDSSAAEKRDYEELRTTRQALHQKSFTALPFPRPAENPRRCREVRIIYTPNEPSTPLQKIVGEASKQTLAAPSQLPYIVDKVTATTPPITRNSSSPCRTPGSRPQ